MPGDGTDCAATGAVCTWDLCGDDSFPNVTAACKDGTWVVERRTCETTSEQCPPSLPTNGTPCSVPEERECRYPTNECCPDDLARCIDETWSVGIVSCNPPPPPPCPMVAPVNGEGCAPDNPCGFSVQSCFYETCDDGVTPVTEAYCDGSSWSVKTTPCPG